MNKITDEELNKILAQQNKLGNLYNQVGHLEFTKSLKVQELTALANEIDSDKKELEKKYGQVNINLQDGSYEEISEQNV
tara:strand:+ start:350 stop:586 length:237 start_codon:yes stop_codon:yes gene_type:complete